MIRSLVPDGKISRAVREGLTLRAKLLADGMEESEADEIIGQGLKGAWGNSIGQSGRVWHYYCERCKDTGWSEIAPDAERLDRLYGPGGAAHSAHVKCDPCPWQERERRQRDEQQAAKSDR